MNRRRRASGSDTDIFELEPLDHNKRVNRACKGRTFSTGGLNMPHLLKLAQQVGNDNFEDMSRQELQDYVCKRYLADPTHVDKILITPCQANPQIFPYLHGKYIDEFLLRVREHIQDLIMIYRVRYENSPYGLIEKYKIQMKAAKEQGDKEETKRYRELKNSQIAVLNRTSEHAEFKTRYELLKRDLVDIEEMKTVIGSIKGGSVSGWFQPYYFNNKGFALARSVSREKEISLLATTRRFLYCVNAIHPEPLPATCVYRWQTMNDINDIDIIHANYTNLEVGTQTFMPFPISTTWNYSWLMNSAFQNTKCCLLVIRIPEGQKYWTVANDSQFEVILAGGILTVINNGTISHAGQMVKIVEMKYQSNLTPPLSIGIPAPNPDISWILQSINANPQVKWLYQKDNGVPADILQNIKLDIMNGIRDSAAMKQDELDKFQENIALWIKSIIVRHLNEPAA